MATVVGVAGVTHNPLFWRAFASSDIDDELRAVRSRFEDLRDHFRGVEPDAFVVVGTDHLTMWSTHNMPSFMVGKAPRFDATFHNEQREFGIPEFHYENAPSLARGLLRGGLDQGFDLSSSDEYRVDHAFSVPFEYLTPARDVPFVPVWTNCIAPPLPRPARFVDFGAALRSSIERHPSDMRVGVIVSGHLSVEVGGPRHFRGAPDDGFDRQAVEWVGTHDVTDAVAGSTFDALMAAGNVTHQFLNFLVAMGVADARPGVAEQLPSRFASAPFFLWEP